MDVLGEDGPPLTPGLRCAVTIGAYDGVHRGHQALLARTREAAARVGAASAVVTFDRHPAQTVRPSSAPRLLCDLEQRLDLLAASGLDIALVVRFDHAASQEPPGAFVRRVLGARLRACAVVVGADFHFGHDRAGDVGVLAAMGRELGFEVQGIEPVCAGPAGPAHVGQLPISSTRIRALVARGAVDEAAGLLGHPEELRGTVVRGDGRGGPVLGYPTANVAVEPELLLPADGVYAGWYLRPSGSAHMAAISVGRRPTFLDAAAPTLEAYLLDFDGQLYGERARVQLVARIRPEERFDTVEELMAAMGRDVSRARALLDGTSAYRPAGGWRRVGRSPW